MPTIRDLSKARIVVVGDAMLDVWVHGRVERISPEAPVPVFVEERREEKSGGAANVVENLRALHCKVRDVTTSGPVKTRFVVNHQQIFRHDDETIKPASKEFDDNIVERVANSECDVLIISDYAKGVCTPSLCQRLIKWAKEHGVKVVVDPKGDDWSKYAGCDVITPNEKEWADVIKSSVPRADLVITKGRAGMEVRLQGCPRYSIEATNSGPVDITGAGDSVIAVLAAASAAGWGLRSAIELANAAAGIVVGKFGTATCSLDELEKAMGQPEAKREIIGFCNGVFDAFHDGHMHFLRECTMNCDKLIIALNSSDYARRLKGITCEPDYIRQTRAKGWGDVYFFDSEEELRALMLTHKPDVIFKGQDYYGKPVTGSDLARIHWVARHPGYSSTIERKKMTIIYANPEPILGEDM